MELHSWDFLIELNGGFSSTPPLIIYQRLMGFFALEIPKKKLMGVSECMEHKSCRCTMNGSKKEWD
jgi:hypothetical protein